MKKLFILIALGCALAAQQMQQQIQRQQQQQVSQDQAQQDTDAQAEFLASPEYQNMLKEEFKRRMQNQQNRHLSGRRDAAQNATAEEHERICPLCDFLSTDCPADQERIQQGIVFTCGCDICGGKGYN